MTRSRRRVLLALATILSAGLVVVIAGSAAPSWPPRFEDVRAAWQPSDLQLLDRHGEVLHERRVGRDVRSLAWAPLAGISPALVEAVIRSEDQRFRSHGGVDFRALAAAARDAVLQGRRRGASTIPMQLAGLLRSDLARRGGRGPLGKLRQMQAARALAAAWSKDQMLEAYLNLASFRGELRGVGAAARGLFDRGPEAVGGAEASVLAALLRAPNADTGTVASRAAALAARSGLAAPEAAEARARAALSRVPFLAPPAVLAPHLAQRLLGPGKGDVVTTLDAGVQRIATRALREQLLLLSGRNVSDGAVLVVENATGSVLAWVGSSGDLSAAPLVDGVRARRQAGSTLKPFLYALAFEERLLTPASRLDDSPLDVATATGVYRPQNYDHAFRGLVTARVALASSLNVPAVRVAQLVGVDRFVSRLGALGFEELRRPDYYGESVALGSADVTLAELVNAYRALAGDGWISPLRTTADAPVGPRVAVMDPAATFLVAQILSDRTSRSETFGFESPLATSFYSVVKTGTSKDMRDNWCIGSTRDLTVGVWVGNFSGAPMHQVSGVDGAAPAWLEIVQALGSGGSAAPPDPPGGVVRHAGEWFLAGTEPLPYAGTVAERPRRIRAPSEGSIIALDPDIPEDRQRIFFESDPPDARLRFRLDDVAAGMADGIVLWPPAKGRHRLELVDGAGRTLHAVRFEVR